MGPYNFLHAFDFIESIQCFNCGFMWYVPLDAILPRYSPLKALPRRENASVIWLLTAAPYGFTQST